MSQHQLIGILKKKTNKYVIARSKSSPKSFHFHVCVARVEVFVVAAHIKRGFDNSKRQRSGKAGKCHLK